MMYSQSIIRSNVEEFERREGWSPIPHTFEEVQDFTAYLKTVYSVVGGNSKSTELEVTKKLTTKRAAEIRRWVENEQALCAMDYKYWERNYAYVVDEKGTINKFTCRKSQEIFEGVVSDFDERASAIQILCGKGRQVGITTLTALYFIHKVLFVPNTLAVMASVQKEKSAEIMVKIDTAYNLCPFWLVPRRTTKSAFSNGSRISIESGMQPKGIAQGKTPTLIHISEIGLIPDPKNVIEEGLLPATHPSRNLFMVFEGTGSGNVGWFPDYWRDQKKNWPLGLARMRPVFIPWPTATDLYPEADWLREHPVPSNFYKERFDATRKHVARCESYIRNTDYLAKIAGRNYTMPLEQQWFWQFEYRQAKERHTLQQHAARLPADDYEMLTGQHDSMFDPEAIEQLESHIYEVVVNDKTGEVTKERKEKTQSYAITGHDIDAEFNPEDHDIDWDKNVFIVEWDSSRGQHYEWEMKPLLDIDEEDETSTFDRLIVYKWPVKGFNYSCGIDTADGLGKPDEDRSCISVAQNRTGSEADIQICEFTTNRLNSAQITAFAACVGAWISPYCVDPRGIKYAIEQIQAPGDTCQHQLKMMGFNNHHDPQRYDNRILSQRKSNKQGFFSTPWTVQILDTRFNEAVNGGWYIPQSRWLIEEFKTLERHERAGKASKIEHRSGSHDDRVKAAAMSYFTAHDKDVLTERAQKRYNLPEKKEKTSKAKCLGGSFNVGRWD